MPGVDDTRRARSAHRTGPTRVATQAAALAAALALVLAGCGSGTPTPAPTPSQMELGTVEDGVHNRQDAAFATDMIIHHRQSIAMARLAKGRTGNEKVLALAQRIEAGQAPEVIQLSRWLADWKQPMPAEAAKVDHAIPGMVSEADLKTLTGAKEDAFDRKFLTLMISHHQGAITQSRDQVKNGADERAKGLAEDIVAAQTAEITEMRTLLG